MSNELEYRSYDLKGVSVDKEKRTIVGRAVPYNSMSNELRTANGDTFREVIMPGAARESLSGNDIMAYKEHDPAMLLGRASAGTLKLEDRADGLYAEISVPETSYGNDTLVSAARGDLKGFSFGFRSPKTRVYTRSGTRIREINSMDLREVSVVSTPAYSSTTLALRAEDFIEESLETTVQEKKPTEDVSTQRSDATDDVASKKVELDRYYKAVSEFLQLPPA